jgi:hypothetical protein
MRNQPLTGLVAVVALLTGCASQAAVHPDDLPVEQQLDDIIRRFAEKPIRIPVALPVEGQRTHLYPVMAAAKEAVDEAKRVCRSQGGVGSERGIFRSGSSQLLQSVRCAKGAMSLWYLDFEQRGIDFLTTPAKDGLLADVTLSIRRLMPSDAPESPVLHWKGTFKDEEDEATAKVAGKLGQRFGIAYSWRFKPQDIKLLEAVWRPASPGIADAESKSLRTEYRQARTMRAECVDPFSCSATWTFNGPEELVVGMWNLSLLADGVPIFSTDFEVFSP